MATRQAADQQAPSGGNGNEAEITLGLLNAIEGNSAVTQRSIAGELGIALGLANAYLKRCVRKGYVKVSQIPSNRYAYYLTPTGFAEKARLTTEYLSASFTFFRRARSQCDAAFADCQARGWRRVALVGLGDLAEIATLSARESGIELVGIIDAEANKPAFAGVPIAAYPKALGIIDAVLITDLEQPQARYQSAAAWLPEDRIFTPPMLGVRRRSADSPADSPTEERADG